MLNIIRNIYYISFFINIIKTLIKKTYINFIWDNFININIIFIYMLNSLVMLNFNIIIT